MVLERVFRAECQFCHHLLGRHSPGSFSFSNSSVMSLHRVFCRISSLISGLRLLVLFFLLSSSSFLIFLCPVLLGFCSPFSTTEFAFLPFVSVFLFVCSGDSFSVSLLFCPSSFFLLILFGSFCYETSSFFLIFLAYFLDEFFDCFRFSFSISCGLFSCSAPSAFCVARFVNFSICSFVE